MNSNSITAEPVGESLEGGEENKQDVTEAEINELMLQFAHKLIWLLADITHPPAARIAVAWLIEQIGQIDAGDWYHLLILYTHEKSPEVRDAVFHLIGVLRGRMQDSDPEEMYQRAKRGYEMMASNGILAFMAEQVPGAAYHAIAAPKRPSRKHRKADRRTSPGLAEE
jgi:hypothetical protein